MPANRSNKADDTVTVRVPAGTADKVRAATGQNFSTVVRWMVLRLLENYSTPANVKEQTREDVQRSIGDALDDRS
jgi:hypothetical protein